MAVDVLRPEETWHVWYACSYSGTLLAQAWMHETSQRIDAESFYDLGKTWQDIIQKGTINHDTCLNLNHR